MTAALVACRGGGGDDDGGKLVERLFGAQDNELRVYDLDSTAESTVLIPSAQNNVNGQVCEVPGGSGNFLMGEDTNQSDGVRQGWGVFSPDGKLVEKYLEPVTEGEAKQIEPYGCVFAEDDRLLTSDVGSGSFDAKDGKLIVYFPPNYQQSCVIDSVLHIAGALAVDDTDAVYVTETVPPGNVFRFSDLPVSADACDPTTVTRSTFIQDAEMTTPLGIARAPNGNWYVASVFLPPTIREYNAEGQFVRTIIEGDDIGNPAGIAVDSQGTLYYADLGLEQQPGELPGPAQGKGTVRKIAFDAAGNPVLPPVVIGSNFTYPDALGIVHVPIEE